MNITEQSAIDTIDVALLRYASKHGVPTEVFIGKTIEDNIIVELMVAGKLKTTSDTKVSLDGSVYRNMKVHVLRTGDPMTIEFFKDNINHKEKAEKK